jgi:hypothetical protein
MGSIDDEEEYIEEALAALRAMREPTESMKQAASMAGSNLYTQDENDLEIWQAMIDKAIKEGE